MEEEGSSRGKGAPKEGGRGGKVVRGGRINEEAAGARVGGRVGGVCGKGVCARLGNNLI